MQAQVQGNPPATSSGAGAPNLSTINNLAEYDLGDLREDDLLSNMQEGIQEDIPSEGYEFLRSERVELMQHKPPENQAAELGCKHYTRRCQLKCSICLEFYTCRLCHDDVKYHCEYDKDHPDKIHKMKTHDVTSIKCLSC